jgi:hypothetical protein
MKFYIRRLRRCKTFCKDKYTRIQNPIQSREKGDVTFDELSHICDAPEDPGNQIAWVICNKQNITVVRKLSLHLPLYSGIVCGPEGYSDPFAPFFNFLEPQLTPPPPPPTTGCRELWTALLYNTCSISHNTLLIAGTTECIVSHNPMIYIFTAVDDEFYIRTSGFWPRVRARALRAPVFLGSLKRQNGRCAPPPSQLPCSPKNKK